MVTQIRDIFHPKSIAVIGVSENPQKLGAVIFNNILQHGFNGALYPISIKGGELYGHRAYQSILDTPNSVDLAVIAIPTASVIPAVKECAKKGVKNLVIISAGFREAGEDGLLHELELTMIIKENDMRLIGPNCLGIISTGNNLNASFAAQHPINGNIAFLSQSGAFNTAILDLAQSRMLGFSYFVSLGNKADINENHLIEEWFHDDDVKVIGGYIEEFDDGRSLAEFVSKNRSKPILILNSGISDAGKKAAQSHTGSLAGSAKSVRTALKQSGIIQVESIERMYSNLMMFSWSQYPKGNRVAIITNAGGPGIILTDQISEAGLRLAELSSETKKQLKRVLPAAASFANPVDLLGDALADRYAHALEIVAADEGVDSILVILTPQLVTQIEETAKVIIDSYRTIQKPIIPIFIGEKYVLPGLMRLWENSIPAFQYDEEAVGALDNLTEYATVTRYKTPIKMPKRTPGRYTDKLQKLPTDNPNGLPADITKLIAEEVGIDTPYELVAKSYDEVLKFFKKGNYPVVIKATAEDAPHKTEYELIYLNIYKEADLERNYRKLVQNIQSHNGNEKPAIIIQEQIFAHEELIMGVSFDPQFGHILLFGKGGIYTEVYQDISTRLVYSQHTELEEMIDETKVSKILKGARGLEKLPTDRIVKTLDALQKIVVKYPEIKSIDINPAMVTINRCIAVDIKMFTQ